MPPTTDATDRICETCGGPMPPRARTGRPAAYCGDDCRRLPALVNELAVTITRIVFHDNDAGRRSFGRLRSLLWGVANSLNAFDYRWRMRRREAAPPAESCHMAIGAETSPAISSPAE